MQLIRKTIIALVLLLGFLPCVFCCTRPGNAREEIPLDPGVVQEEEPSKDPELSSGTNVYGYVTCAGKGLDKVVVSDGYAITCTDADGFYQLKSAKKHGYVFISIPSGYKMPLSNNVLPQFYKYLDKPVSTPERRDFVLTRDMDQARHKVFFIGDMQLARRSDDIAQFYRFTKELASYVESCSGTRLFAVTLGDMTWDSHWLSGPYGFSDYMKDIKRVGNLEIFHAMGNHDHELEAAGDFETAAKFKKCFGPTYYSFNVGEIHYIVLDNIECTNDGTGQKASYNDRLVEEQLAWLKGDLKYVKAETPLVIVMHAPLFKKSGKNSLDNASDFLDCLKERKNVLLETGHTHIIYNVDKTSEYGIFEQNSGSVCATWWYTGYDTPWLHIGCDGSPGGYRVCDVDGKSFNWYFKGIERPADYQFRTYDRNMIYVTPEKYVPAANDEYRQKFVDTIGEYGTIDNDNWIYINVWDYDPAWKIEVKEAGQSLDVVQFEGYDSLHLIAYNAVRANMNKSLSFPSKSTRHLFKAKAKSTDSTVEVIVTDRFGREYREEMKRPKPFTIEEYL